MKKLFVTLAYMAVIFIVSSIPGDKNANSHNFIACINPNIQNFLHLPVYGILSCLWLCTLKNKFPFKISIILALIITIVYGIFDEFHQSFVPGRCASLTDITLNTFGAILGAIIYNVRILAN